ncbi:MAG: 4-hydroxy-tetrahydrodipicolinate reductase [Clostridia bacterium]|nr:4-hydroxy-tetrahydrodipicolinate reductase [Clostridia bacterium]
MIKVLINGCNGKMGQEVAKIVNSDNDCVLVGGVDKENTGEYTFPVYTNVDNIKEEADVIIDFSIPIATMNILRYAKDKHIPIVIATTGINEEQEAEIREASKVIPVFKSANMSFDINLMCRIVANLAKQLKGNDIEIVETHHNRKIDSPSGTAMLLADSINNALDNTMSYEFNRHDKHEKRSKNEIGISSIRGGNIVGEHSVIFFSENESFEIKHTSYSRSVFADGAVKAAKFIVDNKFENGFYDMNDIK